MKQPWQTLLGQYSDHWFLADFLHGDAPQLNAIMDDERWWALSSGEQAMVLCAQALMRISECWLAVDEDNRLRIDYAIRVAVDA